MIDAEELRQRLDRETELRRVAESRVTELRLALEGYPEEVAALEVLLRESERRREVACEALLNLQDTLTQENARLRKELERLRAILVTVEERSARRLRG